MNLMLGGQLDCVDETANTTVLLVMLDRAGLLRWHRPGAPAGRGNLIDGLMPHRTASIVEWATGAEFAVDSWFHGNGVKPEVVEMSRWLKGWAPVGTPPISEAERSVRTALNGHRPRLSSP